MDAQELIGLYLVPEFIDEPALIAHTPRHDGLQPGVPRIRPRRDKHFSQEGFMVLL